MHVYKSSYSLKLDNIFGASLILLSWFIEIYVQNVVRLYDMKVRICTIWMWKFRQCELAYLAEALFFLSTILCCFGRLFLTLIVDAFCIDRRSPACTLYLHMRSRSLGLCSAEHCMRPLYSVYGAAPRVTVVPNMHTNNLHTCRLWGSLRLTQGRPQDLEQGGADSSNIGASEASAQNLGHAHQFRESSKFVHTCMLGQKRAAKVFSLKIVEYSDLSVSFTLLSWLF